MKNFHVICPHRYANFVPPSASTLKIKLVNEKRKRVYIVKFFYLCHTLNATLNGTPNVEAPNATLNTNDQRLPSTSLPTQRSTSKLPTQPSTPTINTTLNVTLNVTLNAYANGTPNVTLNDGTFIVEALNVEALNVEGLNDGTFIDETFNDRALDVYTLFLFKFIKNFASQVALGGSKFAYLCGHIT